MIEFGKHGKDSITLEELLKHEAGSKLYFIFLSKVVASEGCFVKGWRSFLFH